jgi:hypothetical protein
MVMSRPIYIVITNDVKSPRLGDVYAYLSEDEAKNEVHRRAKEFSKDSPVEYVVSRITGILVDE